MIKLNKNEAYKIELRWSRLVRGHVDGTSELMFQINIPVVLQCTEATVSGSIIATHVAVPHGMNNSRYYKDA